MQLKYCADDHAQDPESSYGRLMDSIMEFTGGSGMTGSVSGVYRCDWCPPDGQCFLCERAEFWDGVTRELAPAFWAGFDEVMNADYRPPRPEDLSGPSDPFTDLETLRRAFEK